MPPENSGCAVQAREDATHATTARQLLAAADTAVTDARCRLPIAAGNKKYCAALIRTLERCRRLYGRFTLRCNAKGATACSTSLAQIKGRHCGASPVLHAATARPL